MWRTLARNAEQTDHWSEKNVPRSKCIVDNNLRKKIIRKTREIIGFPDTNFFTTRLHKTFKILTPSLGSGGSREVESSNCPLEWPKIKSTTST